jgi:cell wall-associated NlpC family hydrolase
MPKPSRPRILAALSTLLIAAVMAACAPLSAQQRSPPAAQADSAPGEPDSTASSVPQVATAAQSDAGPPEDTMGPPTLAPRAREANLVERALALQGVPYRYGGDTPSEGFDCSGFVRFVFAIESGVALPRSALAMSRMSAPSVAHQALRVADLLFFRIGRRVAHVGMYLGGGRFVHAPSRGGRVRIDMLDDHYWRARFAGAKRVLLSTA